MTSSSRRGFAFTIATALAFTAGAAQAEFQVCCSPLCVAPLTTLIASEAEVDIAFSEERASPDVAVQRATTA